MDSRQGDDILRYLGYSIILGRILPAGVNFRRINTDDQKNPLVRQLEAGTMGNWTGGTEFTDYSTMTGYSTTYEPGGCW